MNLTEWYETGDRFEWRGQEVFYQEAGEGEVIFLLHGFMTSSWVFKDIWDHLSEHYRVVAPDFVGYGYSSKPSDYIYSFDEKADLVYALAELLKVDRINLLTCSFSNSVAQELMLRCHKGRSRIVIESMALLNGALFHKKVSDPWVQKIMLNPAFSWISKFYGRRTFKSVMKNLVGRYSDFSDQHLDELFELNRYNQGLKNLIKLNGYINERKTRSETWKAALFNTEIPVQLIWGIDSEDQIVGLKTVHEYRKHRGEQYVVMIKDIGHFPQVECPELVVDYYMSFLDGLRDKPFQGCRVEATS